MFLQPSISTAQYGKEKPAIFGDVAIDTQLRGPYFPRASGTDFFVPSFWRKSKSSNNAIIELQQSIELWTAPPLVTDELFGWQESVKHTLSSLITLTVLTSFCASIDSQGTKLMPDQAVDSFLHFVRLYSDRPVRLLLDDILKGTILAYDAYYGDARQSAFGATGHVKKTLCEYLRTYDCFVDSVDDSVQISLIMRATFHAKTRTVSLVYDLTPCEPRLTINGPDAGRLKPGEMACVAPEWKQPIISKKYPSAVTVTYAVESKALTWKWDDAHHVFCCTVAADTSVLTLYTKPTSDRQTVSWLSAIISFPITDKVRCEKKLRYKIRSRILPTQSTVQNTYLSVDELYNFSHEKHAKPPLTDQLGCTEEELDTLFKYLFQGPYSGHFRHRRAQASEARPLTTSDDIELVCESKGNPNTAQAQVLVDNVDLREDSALSTTPPPLVIRRKPRLENATNEITCSPPVSWMSASSEAAILRCANPDPLSDRNISQGPIHQCHRIDARRVTGAFPCKESPIRTSTKDRRKLKYQEYLRFCKCKAAADAFFDVATPIAGLACLAGRSTCSSVDGWSHSESSSPVSQSSVQAGDAYHLPLSKRLDTSSSRKSVDHYTRTRTLWQELRNRSHADRRPQSPISPRADAQYQRDRGAPKDRTSDNDPKDIRRNGEQEPDPPKLADHPADESTTSVWHPPSQVEIQQYYAQCVAKKQVRNSVEVPAQLRVDPEEEQFMTSLFLERSAAESSTAGVESSNSSVPGYIKTLQADRD